MNEKDETFIALSTFTKSEDQTGAEEGCTKYDGTAEVITKPVGALLITTMAIGAGTIGWGIATLAKKGINKIRNTIQKKKESK